MPARGEGEKVPQARGGRGAGGGAGGLLAFYFCSSGRDLVEEQADRPDLIMALVPRAGEKHTLQAEPLAQL